MQVTLSGPKWKPHNWKNTEYFDGKRVTENPPTQNNPNKVKRNFSIALKSLTKGSGWDSEKFPERRNQPKPCAHYCGQVRYETGGCHRLTSHAVPTLIFAFVLFFTPVRIWPGTHRSLTVPRGKRLTEADSPPIQIFLFISLSAAQYLDKQ